MAINVETNQQGAAVISFTDWAYLVRELRKIDPTLLSGLKADAKQIAKPLNVEVRRAIPNKFPLSGMKPAVVPGRLTWGSNVQNGKKPPRSTRVTVYGKVTIKQPKRSIVRVEVRNAAVVMADMAGVSGRYTQKRKVTREYLYAYPGGQGIGVRKHRINGQGYAMIRKLGWDNGYRKSRFAWKAAETAMPKVRAEAIKTIRHYNDIINARMRVASGK